MIIYFKEKTFCDNSRPGYNDCFIDYSLTKFEQAEPCGDVVYYSVKISDKYTIAEANAFAGKAIKNANDNKVTVLFALKELVDYELV